MELLFALAIAAGFIVGSSNSIQKCENNPKWCKKAAAKIEPAPEQDLVGTGGFGGF